MKILHVANFSLKKYGRQFYAMDRKLSLGFAQLGHFVYDFSYRDVARAESTFGAKQIGARAMNRALLETAAAIRPDLLLLGHSELVTPATLAALRRAYPKMAVAMWYVDAFTEKKRASVGAKIPYLDALFATTAGDELASLREFGSATLNYLPNLCHIGIESGKAFLVEKCQYDFMFVGTGTPERHELLECVRQHLPVLRCAFRGLSPNDKVLGADYVELVSNSAMGLNFSRFNNSLLYSSDRLIQLFGNGTLVFSPPIPGLGDLFDDDEFVIFSNAKDLCEKLALYRENPVERCKVAEKGYRRAHADYSSARGAQYLLDVLGGNDLSAYAWSPHRFDV